MRLSILSVFLLVFSIMFTASSVYAETTVCTSSPIPKGFVIIRYGSRMSCPNWSPGRKNTKTIKLPGKVETVCTSSPIPKGFVVVRYGSQMSCPNWSPGRKNTKTIKKVR